MKDLKTIEEKVKYFLGFIAFTYCTKLQIPIPKDKGSRKAYYLRKKK